MRETRIDTNTQWTVGHKYHIEYDISVWKIAGYDITPQWVKNHTVTDIIEQTATRIQGRGQISSYYYDDDSDKVHIYVTATGPASPIIIVIYAAILIASLLGVTLVLNSVYRIVDAGNLEIPTPAGKLKIPIVAGGILALVGFAMYRK